MPAFTARACVAVYQFEVKDGGKHEFEAFRQRYVHTALTHRGVLACSCAGEKREGERVADGDSFCFTLYTDEAENLVNHFELVQRAVAAEVTATMAAAVV